MVLIAHQAHLARATAWIAPWGACNRRRIGPNGLYDSILWDFRRSSRSSSYGREPWGLAHAKPTGVSHAVRAGPVFAFADPTFRTSSDGLICTLTSVEGGVFTRSSSQYTMCNLERLALNFVCEAHEHNGTERLVQEAEADFWALSDWIMRLEVWLLSIHSITYKEHR